MNTEKIEKLKKGLTNSQIPESLREKIREQIKKMEAEDLKESTPKVVNVAPEEKEEPTPAPKVEKAKVTRTPRVKKVVAHKESTTKKPTAMALAKEIRKDGESWKEAVKRASSEMKKGTTETKKAVVETKKATITEMQKLLKFVKRRKELKNISGTNLQRDASRSAKPSGKRTSKEGNVYYENRENRTDRLAPNYPKGAPKLNDGGMLNSYNVIYLTTNGKLLVAKNIMAVNEEQAEAKLKKEMSASNTFDKVVSVIRKSFSNGGMMDGVYAENGAEVYRKKASENQKEKEKSMVFKKYRVNVYEDSYPFVDPHYTDNFVEAVNFAKKTIKEQKQYRPSSKDLFTSIDKFTPIEQRGNVIYPYYEIARFNEKDLNESKFANGGMMNNMSVHEGTDFMNTPVYAGGGSIASKYVLVQSRGYDGGVIFLVSREELNKIPYQTMQEKAEAFVENVTDYNGDTPYRNGRLITDTKKINNYAKGHSHYNYKVILSDDEDNYPDGFYVIKHKEPLKFNDGGFMDGVYAEEGAEVTYTRNKDGIRVKSVAMPEERLTEAEWLAKHNESREARTYAVGGGIFADTFTGTTGTHYTGLVGETNAMSSGEMFMAGGRVRRTKAQMTKDRENKEIDAYNWYVVDLEENKAITGNEYREDAVDALSDYDGDKRYKVVSKKTLKSLGIENPNERFKSYEVGGGVGDKKYHMIIQQEDNYIYIKMYDKSDDRKEYGNKLQELLMDITNYGDVDVVVYETTNEIDTKEKFEKYFKNLQKELNEYAKGGGVRTQNGREYSLGRNWTNDHRHENKHEDYEVSMYKRK